MKTPFFSLMMVAALMLLGCLPASALATTATPLSATALAPTLPPSQQVVTSSATPLSEEVLLVAYSKNGDLHLWDSETRQSRILVKAGDITTVTLSDDGQVIAFLRRSLAEQPELMEYVSLWAVNRSGENPRELVSADTLRQRLNPHAEDSAAFAQISWIPGTHRLVYNASKHYVPGQGSTLSTDIYLVDAGTGADTVLAANVMPDTPFVNAWGFEISPDGQQIALISGTALSFINADGSNWRQAVLTYPQVGAGDAVLLPSGVWTQDSNAFVFTGPMQSESIFILNYTIWRVPADGSPAGALATLTDSHSGSVSLSPDGKQMAFSQDINGDGTIQPEDHQIMPLAPGVSPLTLPFGHEQSYVLWSPGGEAFVIKDQALFGLCPDAANASEVCGDPIPLAGGGELIDGFEWVDEERFFYTVVEPTRLSLGRLDGTITPIATWAADEPLAGWSFSLGR